MAEIGMKGSVPGSDVLGAIDYIQQSNSSWPHLKAHSTGIYSSTVTHGLSYYPFFFTTTTLGQVDEFSAFGVDASTLVRLVGSDTPRYYIFRLDLETAFTAPVISGSTTTGAATANFGFKLSQPGKDISSADMRDFTMHSSTRTPLIHKIDNGLMSHTGGGLGWERIVTHGLSYIPYVFVFIKPGVNSSGRDVNKYQTVPPPVGTQDFYYTVNSSTVYITADDLIFSSASRISVVVLKDPFNLPGISRSYP